MRLFALCVVFYFARGKVLEQPDILSREDWIVMAPTAGWETHEVTIAVRQLNLDRLHEKLMDVSTPGSANRGKYLSFNEAHALTANKVGMEAVLKWLGETPGMRIGKIHKFGHYIHAETNVSTWEKLLETKFAHMASIHEPSNVVLRAVKGVSVPYFVQDAIAGIFKTTQLPPRPRVRASPRFLRDLNSSVVATGVTPAGLKNFYHVSGTGASDVSQAVFESLGQYTSPSDLASFEKLFGLASEKIAMDIGGHESDFMCRQNPNSCTEANLDVQYMMAISPITPETYWYESNQNTPFESWIEAVASTANPPLVHSISYGSLEPEIPASIADTFNTEAMRLGAQGVTIFVSSGDDGVANFQARDAPSKCSYTPSFPASSPYVTAVGATQGGVTGGTETVCSAQTGGVITSGGGFSTKFDAPAYQKQAISEYFQTVSTQPVAGFATGGRGYPDVAMAGHNYEVVISGSVYSVSGTSASAPVTAGMASLVNAKLKANGGSSLGFINPTLYAAGSSSFNSITSGNNKCTASKTSCCSQGFNAAAGWDPITGWGSVDYAKFESLFVHESRVVV